MSNAVCEGQLNVIITFKKQLGHAFELTIFWGKKQKTKGGGRVRAFAPWALLPLCSPWCITLAEAAAWHRTSCLMEFQEITVMRSISAPGKTDDASWLWQIFGDKHNAKRVEGKKNTIMQVLPAENYQLKSGGNNAKTKKRKRKRKRESKAERRMVGKWGEPRKRTKPRSGET